MRQLLIAGNWKMHGTRASAARLAGETLQALDASTDRDIVVCPPFVHLVEVGRAIQGSSVILGAQNLCAEEDGAYTGEVSGAMLRDCGCRYVIVGHSERRALYGENDALVARKFMAAQRASLTPILCLGETLEQRRRGQSREVVTRQLHAVLDAAGIAAFGQATIAYEPVWAIGTGNTATPEQAQEVHALIRSSLAAQDAKIAAAIRLLYGGSVKASNAAALFHMPDIDGGLVGGASLQAQEFAAICRAGAASI
ncbi:MAG: triose-phosphate isomerase [Gammaproteobacteria bacterium]|nr:triose-phosphate isomerase [Gammaproteobacteria bacterium]MBU6508630.1 triose-phosphate isomerase [Gammaproteobacteria bacterium]MDE1983015.1 triose-phosphate isomerase [Gammaproteobacteria bacterium]MDE2108864.1 triose-phosphate isomerase [Gammaproteobacteria bacterium]